MSLTINSRLCIAPIGRPPVIRVSQYDSDFEILFEMYTIESIEWDLEAGTTAKIRGTKTDKRGYSADCDIDIEHKLVTVYGDIQMTAAAGPCVYEIVLMKGTKELGSINFTLQVERAALDADTIPSESQIKEIQEIGQKADEIIEAYENLQFDTTPTAGSTKAVTSGGIKTYVDDATATDTTLSEAGKPADAKVVGDEVTDLKSAIGNKSNLNTNTKTNLVSAINEVNGHFLDGIDTAVENWLGDHPEATTTVQDGSLTLLKFKAGELPFVTPEMFGAKGDGETDDTEAMQDAFESNMPVVLSAIYAISNGLTYTGNYIGGNGKILVTGNSNDSRCAILCSGKDVTVEGFEIDCGSKIAIGILANVTGVFTARKLTVYNTNNGNNTYSCAGIFASNCKSAVIDSCYAHDINRTSVLEYTISSVGIGAYASDTIIISNCTIRGVKCSNQLKDCDAIFVSKPNNTDYVSAMICNNKLYDATGRFVKIQVDTTSIINNIIKQDSSVFDTNSFKAIDVQYGDCTVINNRINLGEAYNRNAFLFCISNTIQGMSHNFVATGNIIDGELPQLVSNVTLLRNIFVLQASAYCKVDAKIEGNMFNIACESVLSVSRSQAMDIKIVFSKNSIHTYQVIEALGITNAKDVWLIFKDNDQTSPLLNIPSRICSESCTFSNLIYKNNKNLPNGINSYPIFYDELGIFDGYYLGAVEGMTGLPTGIPVGGQKLYLKKDANITHWAYPVSGTSGVVDNSNIILDSWEEIIEAIDNGSYASRYNVGDIKRITINNVEDYAVLVAKDTDTLADSSNKAKTTWISRPLLGTHSMNSSATNEGGWEQSGLRFWLRETILPTINSTITENIKEVTKTYYDYTSSSTLSVSDTIWIPSALEMFGGTSYESSGCDYTSVFDSNGKRIKQYLNGTTDVWWLRSAFTNNTAFRVVGTTGEIFSSSAQYGSLGVIIGFCI